jgi:hypothetical protein
LAAASAGGLAGGAEESVKGIVYWLWGGGDGVLLDLQHLSPHVLGAGLAVFNVVLDIGVEDLDVVEDHGEGDQTGGDSHGGEDHGGEGRGAHAGFLVHLFVLDHD